MKFIYAFTWVHFLVCYTAVVAQQQPDYVMPENGICAHRGGMDTHPENTIPAFKNAIAAGVQMIEFDIQFSKDSALVIMHDETVDRTTDDHGKISDLTMEEIRKLDAGVKKGKAFHNTSVPTLEETLAIMPKNIWLNCHVKGDAAIGRAVAKAVQKSGRMHQCFLACNELAATGARSVVPAIFICNADNRYRRDLVQYVEATIRQKAHFIQLVAVGSNEERKPFIRQLKNNGVKVNYFYAAKANEAAALWQAGVNFILVNDLPLFIPEMTNYGIKVWKNEF